ncbi:hypothetical protein TPA0907_48040 [Micromonospora humidisoli]|nr:hypothetical protein TPA0907_48040 [Micromonospora sp. AKA109]
MSTRDDPATADPTTPSLLVSGLTVSGSASTVHPSAEPPRTVDRPAPGRAGRSGDREPFSKLSVRAARNFSGSGPVGVCDR